MNLADKILRSQLELTKPIADGSTLEVCRSLQDKIGRLMHFQRRKEVVVYDDYFEGVLGSLVVPRDELRGGVIMYIHGGGFTCGSIKYARGFAAVLAAECGTYHVKHSSKYHTDSNGVRYVRKEVDGLKKP